MMANDGIDIGELTKFEQELINFANDTMKKESKEFLRKTGTKLKSATLKKAKSKVKKDDNSGKYFKSIKRGKVYNYNDSLAVRTYSNDNKAHLLEKGHRMVTHDGEEVGWVDGYHIFEDAEKEFESVYYDECEKFVDKIIDKINE